MLAGRIADRVRRCYIASMVSIPITRAISIDSDDLEESFTRASGPGGQHVNTTDSAVLLRFHVGRSALPDRVKARLAVLAGSRLSKEGVLTLRSEGARSQALNRQEVRERLVALIREATVVQAKRRPTKPTRASQVRRVDAKKGRAAVKAGRQKPRE